MFINTLVSLCSVIFSCDTIDVATVSAPKPAAVTSVSPVRSMTEAQIERTGAVSLHEVLGRFAGVSVKDYGGVGGLKTVSVRNMGATHTTVVYDGITISDAQNGQVDISRFNLDDMVRTGVSIGMPEDIFCSARQMTRAGVLFMDTSEPLRMEHPFRLNTRMTIGAFSTYSPYISASGKIGNHYALKASASAVFSDGDYPYLLHNGDIISRHLRTNSDIASGTGEVSFHADWTDRGRLKAMVLWHESERGLPGSVIFYTSNPVERLKDRNIISSISYDNEFGEKWMFHTDASFTHTFNHHHSDDPRYPSPQDSRYSQNEYSIAFRTLYRISDIWRISLAEDLFVNNLDSDIPECPFPLRLTSVSALAAQYSGVRLKVNTAVAGTFVSERVRNGRQPKDRFRISPMIGLSWTISRGLHFRASIKDGFRMPTFNDLYYSRVGNVDLKPERAFMSNLGLTYTGNIGTATLSITLDGYCNLIRDKIVATPTMFIWKMRNVGEVVMSGADVTVACRRRIWSDIVMNLEGAYSLQYALDVTDAHSKSYQHQIPYTPRHCGSANCILETPWADFSYTLTAVGKRYDKAQNLSTNMLQPYFDHGICIGRSFTFRPCRLHIDIQGQNLGNMNYEVISHYPMPGRSFRVTLKYNY